MHPAQAPQSHLLKAGICSVIAVALALVVLPSTRYATNDDVALVTIVSGMDGFPADTHVPFISRTLSVVLVRLYTLAPDVPWYGLALYLTLILAATLHFSLWFFPHVDRFSKSLIFPAQAALVWHWFYAVSFTSATLLLEFGVFLHLLAWLTGGRSIRLRPWLLTFCLLLACLWRWDVLALFSVFGLPLLCFARREDFRKALPCGLVVAAFLAVDRTWHYMTTRSPAHQQFREFQKVRSRFFDTPSGTIGLGTESALAAVNWTMEDFTLIKSYWVLYDERLTSTGNLETFLRKNDEIVHVSARLRKALEEAYYKNVRNGPAFVFALFAVLLFRGRDFVNRPRGQRTRTLVSLGLLALCFLGLLLYRFPARVSMPLMAYVLGVLIVLRRDEEPGDGETDGAASRRFRTAATVFLLVSWTATIHWMWVDWGSLRSNREQWEFTRDSIHAAMARSGQRLLFIPMHYTAIRREFMRPLWERDDWGNIHLMQAGWATRSPRYKVALQSRNLTTGEELLKSAIDSDEIRLVLFSKPDDYVYVNGALSLWMSYFNRHVGKDGNEIRFVLACSFIIPDRFFMRIYRLATVEQHPQE